MRIEELTDRDLIDLMIAIDSDNFAAKHLNIRYHPARWWTLYEELRRRHAEDWDAWITVA